jgi:hypothetical protein
MLLIFKVSGVVNDVGVIENTAIRSTLKFEYCLLRSESYLPILMPQDLVIVQRHKCNPAHKTDVQFT